MLILVISTCIRTYFCKTFLISMKKERKKKNACSGSVITMHKVHDYLSR